MGGGTNSVNNCSSTSASNGYQESEDNIVSNNTLVNTNVPLFYNGDNGKNDVTGTVSNNLIYYDNNSRKKTDIIAGDDSESYSRLGSTLSYNGNLYNNTSLGENVNGFSSSNLSASRDDEIFNISGASGKGADISNSPLTDNDVASKVGACFLNASRNTLPGCDGSTSDFSNGKFFITIFCKW